MTAHCKIEPSTKIYNFDEITVKTAQLPSGDFCAVDNENYDFGAPMGMGVTRFSAIADLFEQLPRYESDREERDYQAAKFDHARDLRKHGVA